jgi:sRNA-binding carbon storage regulator CsrA
MLLRQAGLSIDVRADVVLTILATHGSELAAAFTVIAPESVRIRRPPHADA